MVGLEGAVSDYGMDEAYDIREADTRLRDMLPDHDRIYHDLGRDPMFDQRLIGWLNEFRGTARGKDGAELPPEDYVWLLDDEPIAMGRTVSLRIPDEVLELKPGQPITR